METPGPPTAKPVPGERYRFDDVLVDAEALTLYRGGEAVPVEPKIFAVLLMLLRQPGVLITRDELLDTVWGHRHVTPGVLTRAIAQLRAALGDDAQRPRFIQTRHAAGYRFIGQLEGQATRPRGHHGREPSDATPSGGDDGESGAADPEADPAGPGHRFVPPGDPERDVVPRWNPHGIPATQGVALAGPLAPVGYDTPRDGIPRRWWGFAMAGAATALLGLVAWAWLGRGTGPVRPVDASVAVLPFTSLSADRDDRYFAEGLASEMHDALAGIPGLKVAALVATPQAGVASQGPVAFGRSLGVATVLDATVRRDGHRVRINARLTDTRSGYTLWAHAYEREAGDVFDMQGEIASKVVGSLVGILPATRPQLARRLRPTLSAPAYDAYLKGVQQLLVPRSERSLGHAIAFFREALKHDAGFARAQAGICRAEVRRFETARDAPALNRARAACERAGSMDPGLLEVSLAMGELDRVRGEYPQAIEHYTRALRDVALRADAYVGLAETQAALGNKPLALDYYGRARQLRPGDAAIHSGLGYLHYLNGDFDKAIESYRIATTLQPDRAPLWSSLGGVYHVSGHRREAADAYSRSLAIKSTYGALSNFASLRFEDGAYAEAADLYRRAAQLEPDDYRLWGNIGDALSADPMTKAQARSPYARAASMAEAYIKLKGDDALAHAHLAWYRANLGKTAGVRELLDRADALGTEKAEVEIFAAQTLARIGDRDGARERVRRALAAGVPLARIRTSPLLRGMDAGGAPPAGTSPVRTPAPPKA